MDMIVKKASALSPEEKSSRGLTGIPNGWPIESYPDPGGDVPEGCERMSEEDLILYRANLQADYDVWHASIFAAAQLMPSPVQTVHIEGYEAPPKTPDGRNLVAANRIPAGYNIFPTGSGDNMETGAFNGGPDILLSKVNPGVVFQLKHAFYAVGGRVIWEGASLDDYFDAQLEAPATTALTQGAGGNVNKIPVAPGKHIIIPAAPGSGGWTLDPLQTLNPNVPVLASTPVPNFAKTGFWNFDAMTNTLTPAYQQNGDFDLFDFDIVMLKFANRCWGKKADGAESSLESSDVVGKLLLSQWRFRFQLTTSSDVCRAGGVLILAVRKNV